MGTLTVDNLNVNSTATISSGVGKVLQVQSSFKSDTDSTTSTSDVAISGLSLTLTPASTSSKVLVQFDVGTMGNNANAHMFYTVYRSIGGGSYSAIGQGTGGGSYNYAAGTYASNSNHYDAVGHCFLDSPNTTSEVTYRIGTKTSNTSQYSRINASNKTFSYVAMEIGA